MLKRTSGIFGLLLALILCTSARSAEKLTLHMAGGQTLRCEVIKITKSDVQVKTEGGKEQTLPLQLIEAQDVVLCYKQAIEPFNAELRFEMGAFFAKKELYNEAKEELNAAARLDDSFKARAEELLKKFPGATPAKTTDVAASDKKPEDKKVVSTDKPPDKSNPKTPGDKAGDSEYSGEMTIDDFRKKFMRKNVPPRTEAQMKDFLAKRLEELNTRVGGKWRLVETKHFYCFSNIDEKKHNSIATNWNEALYDILCRVLKHKEGDKLWNNKMPIYYFAAFKQFQRFAAEIDKSPGAGYSGGYFSAEGREVHICIPFMSEKYRSEADQVKMYNMAHSTLFHEGTHAFLQLSGEDVELSRSLHEGMAQFIEFWSEGEDAKRDKNERLNYLRDYIAQHRIAPDWIDMEQRPRSGMDGLGYACAYAKLEFLYRNFDNQCLPKMIRLIKSGKKEKEALETTFGHTVDQMEDVYIKWLKDALKKNFNFN